VPSPAAVFAFALARLSRRPVFLLVVGDLGALLPSMPYRGLKRGLWRAYTEFEERSIQWMVRHALTFANGRALVEKHAPPRGGSSPIEPPVETPIETTTTTVRDDEIANRGDTCNGATVRALTVSRVDPRKGLRVLPAAVHLIASEGIDLRLDLVGPTVGRPGEDERAAILEEAVRHGVRDRVSLIGPVPLDRLLPMYGQYDLFVLPTLPGEGIPRVLLEAMSAGLPIVTTRVAGIPSLVTHEVNGLLVDRPTPVAIAAAMTRIVRDARLRQTLINKGYETAHKFTLETQSARMMEEVSRRLHLVLRRPVIVPAA
jgi:glycosyltransferase involved in cell wall biosynthesis